MENTKKIQWTPTCDPCLSPCSQDVSDAGVCPPAQTPRTSLAARSPIAFRPRRPRLAAAGSPPQENHKKQMQSRSQGGDETRGSEHPKGENHPTSPEKTTLTVWRGFQPGVVVTGIGHDGQFQGRHPPILVLEVVVPRVVNCRGDRACTKTCMKTPVFISF
jgi:hypothetical protein